MSLSSYASPTTPLAPVARVLVDERIDLGDPVSHTISVLDTFDGRLYRAGLLLLQTDQATLELRSLGGAGVPARMRVTRQVRFAADLPRGAFRSRLEAVTDVRALGAVLQLAGSVRSGTRRDSSGKSIVSVAMHQQVRRVAAGPHGMPGRHTGEPSAPALSWVIEVHEHAGHQAAASRVARALEEVGATGSSGGVVELLASQWGVDLRGVEISPTAPLSPTTPAAHAVRAVLANLDDAIEANWLGTLDDVDPEFLHDLRVGVRRTRSVLAAAKHVLPADVRDHFRAELGWLGGVTGPPRDLDVYVIEWGGYLAPLSADAAAHLDPVLEHLQQHRERAHVELVAAMTSPRAVELRRAWQSWLADSDEANRGPTPDGTTPRADEPIRDVVVRLIRSAHDTVIANGRAIGSTSPGELLHDLRKDAKKLRYLLECFGSVLPSKERKAFVAQLRSLQDNLGEHQDAEVHAEELRAVARELDRASTSADTLMALGQLSEHLDRRRHITRAEFAERFAAYDAKPTRAALRALLDTEPRGR